MTRWLYLARFFLVVPPMPLLMVGALIAATSVAAVVIVVEPSRVSGALTLSPAAQEALRAYQWPGNVRELQRVIERAVALAERDSIIELDDLPPQVRGEFTEVLWPSLERGDSLRSWGTRYAQLVFERCGRNKRTACRVLDISYHTLRGYLRPAAKRRGRPPALALEEGPPSPPWIESTSDPAGPVASSREESSEEP